MDEHTKKHFAYAWWWIWLTLVTYGSVWFYLELAGTIKNTGPIWLTGFFEALGIDLGVPPEAAEQSIGGLGNGLYNPISSLLASWQEGSAAWPGHFFAIVAGLLFWWRVIKVIVLHGSPLPWWLTASQGRSKHDGVRGFYSYIGDIRPDVVRANQGFLLFAAVFRKHPSSDKLMRTRLASLLVTLPLDLTMVVLESKIRFRVFDHNHRARMVRHWVTTYEAPSDPISDDAFRRSVIKKLDAIAKKDDDEEGEIPF